ncbi:MAG: Xaa-Pro dipeptidase [Polyangiaceae bacterium]
MKQASNDSSDLRATYREHVAELVRDYEKALAAHDLDGIVVHSGSAKKKSIFDDQYFPHRPTPHFQHWANLWDPDCAVVFAVGRKPRLYWPPNTSFWERPRPVDASYFEGTFELHRGEVQGAKGTFPARMAFIGETPERAAELGIEAVNPPALLATLDALRSRKTAYEVACLQRANDLAAKGHEALRVAFQSGDASELELHLAYLAATGQDDPETPYKNIVAAGENAAILHHIAYGTQRQRARSLLVDAGAVYRGYCSDITRTWVRPGSAGADTFAELALGLEEAQKGLAARVQAGAVFETLHDDACRAVATLLKKAGVLRDISAEEADAKGISRVFLPHGLGHSLGLQTHDVGCALRKPKAENPFLRHTASLEVGQVITIEPGIYFIDTLLAELREKPEGSHVDWKLVEELSHFGGIRIEDDIVVTSTGSQNLTRPFLPEGAAYK